MQLQGNVAHRFHVFGYILTRCAIAARGSLNQNTVLIQQANRQTVKLGLNNVFGVRRAQILAHTLVKRAHFGMVKRARVVIARRKRICQRQHRHGMDYRFKAIQHRTAHAVGGAFRQPEIRILGFQRLQFAV